MNFGTARNLGAEVDVMKYFNWFGIKANYTYTHSKVTTDKRVMDGSEVTSKRQSRPLFGQAAHVANLSFLFKDTKHGWEGQLAGSYTGKRLSDISKRVGRTVSVFLPKLRTCLIFLCSDSFRRGRIQPMWIRNVRMVMSSSVRNGTDSPSCWESGTDCD